MVINNEFIAFTCIVFVAIFSLFITRRFKYTISDGSLFIEWHMLWIIKYAVTKISRDNIESIGEPVITDIICMRRNLGNTLSKKSIVIKLKHGMFKNVFITPENIDEFIKCINQYRGIYN